ncbi:hypothetical protein DM01DRAFT_1387301 [Hesseltinella vesiculosa]|uniref:Protein UNC80 C-terminal domain-containing protein n=1 Tax=Hesseltinella vesiculosa TaxID=101127 RepID=A0A1X2G2D6_9FUNG|nr:hypothetical protein DM01DRAFT_1387301 [Hesseltinella vesiculosa]
MSSRSDNDTWSPASPSLIPSPASLPTAPPIDTPSITHVVDAQQRWSRLREAVLTNNDSSRSSPSSSPSRQSRHGLFNTFRPFNPLQEARQLQKDAVMTPFATTKLSGLTRDNKAGIYAATTIVQQDKYRLERESYRLERELKKILIHPHSLNRNATLAVADQPINLHAELTLILDTLHQHPQANKIPLLDDLLTFIVCPFYHIPVQVPDCQLALDVFEYIRQRFTNLNTMENYEMALFCCRALAVQHTNLKLRVISFLRDIASSESQAALPSLPCVFHSLVYTLTEAMVCDILQTSSPDNDRTIHKSILDLLDALASGKWIPVLGEGWETYCKPGSSVVPVAVARFCVLEGLCKVLMINHCGEVDPYKDTINRASEQSFETVMDQLILEQLLNRYWEEPTIESLPSFLSAVFTLSEAAIEMFLYGSKDDLTHPKSSASLLWQLFQEKLPVIKLRQYVSTASNNKLQQAVATNAIITVMTLLSICRLDLHSIDGGTTATSHADGDLKVPRLLAEQKSCFQVTVRSAQAYFTKLWRSGFQDDIIALTHGMLEDSAGERVMVIYENMAFYLDDSPISEEIVNKTLPVLFNRLTSTYPAPFPTLCQLLVKLSKGYRLAFYRPVVSCVAAKQPESVVSWLALFSCLRRYMSAVQLWMQDGEMICVLLLSDVGMSEGDRPSSVPSTGVSAASWGSTSLGQCVVAAELLWAVRELRQRQHNPERNMEEDELGKKFLIDLERRFAVFMAAKEKSKWIPMPLRVIISNLLSEIRFFCNTTHRPGWLTRAIEWAVQPLENDSFTPIADSAPGGSVTTVTIHPAMLEDASLMFERIGMVYATTLEQLVFESSEHIEYGGERPMMTANQSSLTLDDVHAQVFNDPLAFRSKRQLIISMVYPINRHASASLDLSPPALTSSSYHKTMATASELSKVRLEELIKIHQDPFEAVLSLLVTVFTTMSNQEFSKLVKPLWQRYMNPIHPSVFLPAAFLFMQCGEKVPDSVIQNTVHDFYDPDPLKRSDALLKLAALSTYRLNVLSLEYIQTSTKRRPFRGDGGAFSTPFVAADLGTDQLTMDEPRWMAKLKNASNFPIELKRQIQELGWDDEDEGEEYEALKKVLTPLVLLPSQYLDEIYDRQDDAEDTSTTRPTNQSTQVGWATLIGNIVSRRKRATVVPSINTSFFSIVDGLCDNYCGVHNSLRELLEKYLRDDPDLFLRGFLSELGKSDVTTVRDTLTRLYALVHMQAKLPPAFTHTLFNNLAGMLKWLCREHGGQNSLAILNLTHSILAQLVLSTNELSMRDFRKNKIEAILVSTGRFWFQLEQPVSMFPRRLIDHRTTFTTLDIPDDLFHVATLRISHIQFLTSFLIRYPREVYAVKKTLRSYERMTGTEQPTSSASSLNLPDDDPDAFYLPDLSLRHSPSHHVHVLRQFQRQEKKSVFNRQPSQRQHASSKKFNHHRFAYPHRHYQHHGHDSDGPMFVPLEMLEDEIEGSFGAGADRQTYQQEIGDTDEIDRMQAQSRPTQEEEDVDMLSLLRDRVWLRFIDTLLNGLNKNYNDRDELERILGSVNGILMRHYYDYGLVGQALVLFTRLATRFKRLFSSNHGYHAFLPALFKVYCQVESYPHIRSAVTFAWCRFYAVHEEAFVFQMLGSLAPLILTAYRRSPMLGAWMADNFFSLMKAMDDPPQLGQTSDVLGLQLQVELDDHERSIQEQIDAVSNPMVMPLATSILKPLARSVTTPITPLVINNYSNQPFPLGNFIKLFLTIIAYDPNSLRAEQFVKIFRHLLPFCFSSSAEIASLIHDGMDALITIFVKFSRNSVPTFGSQTSNTNTEHRNSSLSDTHQQQDQQQRQRLLNEGDGAKVPGEGNFASAQHAYGKNWQQNDRYTIKVEFTRLIRQFYRCGGHLAEQQRTNMGFVLRMVLRDTGIARSKRIKHTLWLKDYWVDEIQAVQPPDYLSYAKAFLKGLHQIQQQWRAQYKNMDSCGIFQGLAFVVRAFYEKGLPLADNLHRFIKERFVGFGLTLASHGGKSGDFSDADRFERFCQALVQLILALMEVPSSVNVLQEFQQVPSTASLFAKVVIPISFEFGQHLPPHHYQTDALMSQWRDLLNIAMKACTHSLHIRQRQQNRSSVPSSVRFSGIISKASSLKEDTRSMQGDVEPWQPHQIPCDAIQPIPSPNLHPSSPTHTHQPSQIRPLPFDASADSNGDRPPSRPTSALNTENPSQTRPPAVHVSSSALLLVLGLTAIKVIVLRGQLHRMDTNSIGLVTRLAYFIKSTLIFDDKLHRGNVSNPSSAKVPSSPLTSLRPSPFLPSSSSSHRQPPSSPISPNFVVTPTDSASRHRGVSGHTPSSPTAPLSYVPPSMYQVSVSTLFDYASWKFLEFIVFTKSPLMLPLSGFVKEKLIMATKDSALSTSQPSPASPISASSPFAPMQVRSPGLLAPTASRLATSSSASCPRDAIAIPISPSSIASPDLMPNEINWRASSSNDSVDQHQHPLSSRAQSLTSPASSLHDLLKHFLDQRYQTVEHIRLLLDFPSQPTGISTSTQRSVFMKSWSNREALQNMSHEWRSLLAIDIE